MSFLTDARADLKALLDQHGYRTFDYRPDRITPPAVVIEFGDPYLTPGRAFGEWSVALQLSAYLAPASNQQATAQLDEALVDLVEALRGSWTVASASAGVFDLGDKAYVGAEIQISSNLAKEPT